MQMLLEGKARLKCWGRNGYFWPKSANVVAFPEVDILSVDIETSRNGARAPIQIYLTRADAAALAQAITEELARPWNPHKPDTDVSWLPEKGAGLDRRAERVKP